MASRPQQAHSQTSIAQHSSPPRDPEDRPIPGEDEHSQREKGHDKTLADSFPTSDPPSSIPDPADPAL